MRETYFEDLILKDDEKEDEYDEEKGAIWKGCGIKEVEKLMILVKFWR